MDFVQEMKKKASALQNTLVLPEGTEERTIIAAAKIIEIKLLQKLLFLVILTKLKKLLQQTMLIWLELT